MKTRNRAVDILIGVSLLGLLSIAFMPAQFPMQYAGDGEVSRWGSRLEFLIYWMIPVAFGIITKGYIAYQRRKQGLHADAYLRNEKPLLVFAIAFMLFFDMLLAYALIRGFTLLSSGAVPSTFHFLNVAIGLVGIVFVVVGNYTPKLEFNAMVGFKNGWSCANEDAWALTHRWLGRLFIVSGLALVAFAALSLNQSFNPVIFLTFVLLLVALSFALSYRAYQRTK